MISLKPIFILILFVLSQPVLGTQQVVIIGGGPTPKESEVSIHLNTEWIIKVINQRDSDLISHIFFTDGNNADVDVRMREVTSDDYEMLKPLALIYGADLENSYKYYSSEVAPSVETTELTNVTGKLRDIFSSMGSGDEMMLIFQGHGDYKRFDTSGNTLRLWNDTKMSVTQLEALMSEAHPESTIRFLLPQCFSGAFSKLIYKNAQINNGVAKGKRCGFLAQNEHTGSEGCTTSVNTSDYQDYSSYFFSAIDNKTIDGKNLNSSADVDKDGTVTLKEAHEYTLSNAFSVDYSRSTSDDYLEHWQPWYLKWMPDFSEPDNIYSRISQDIAKRFNIQGSGKQLINAVADRSKKLENQSESNKQIQLELENKIKASQKIIRADLEFKWPQLSKPYTSQFRNVLNNQITVINVFLKNHSDYPGLVEDMNKFNSLEIVLLDIRRNIIQMMKILRMRDMARLLDKFQNFASKKEIAEYEELLQCENASIF